MLTELRWFSLCFADRNDTFMQIVNFGSNIVNLTISIASLDSNYIKSVGSLKTVLTSSNLMDGNSFKEPNKVHHHCCFICSLHFDCDGWICLCKHSLEYR